jgi:hypothetical protein
MATMIITITRPEHEPSFQATPGLGVPAVIRHRLTSAVERRVAWIGIRGGKRGPLAFDENEFLSVG